MNSVCVQILSHAVTIKIIWVTFKAGLIRCSKIILFFFSFKNSRNQLSYPDNVFATAVKIK